MAKGTKPPQEMDIVRSLIAEGSIKNGADLSRKLMEREEKQGPFKGAAPLKLPGFILEEIEIDGFGPHGGPNRLDIADGLTLVTGENGSGKTHILLALHWCLFGDRGSMDPWLSEADPLGRDLVNWERNADGVGSMSVSVRFRFNGTGYAVKRSMDGKGTSSSVQILSGHGRGRAGQLPKGLTLETLPYLIFQGEAVMFLASEDPFLREGNLKRVITVMSGVLDLEREMELVGDAREYVARRLKEARNEASPLENERERIRSKLQVLKSRKEELKNDIRELERVKKASMREYRRALSELSGMVKERERDGDLALIAARMPLLEERITDILERAPAEVLRKPAGAALMRCLVEKEIRTRKRILFGAFGSQVSIVESILRTNRCLCGTSIGRTGAGRERLEALRARLGERTDEVSDWGRDTIWTADTNLESVRRYLSLSPIGRSDLKRLLDELDEAVRALDDMASQATRTEGELNELMASITKHERAVLSLGSARKELKTTIAKVRSSENMLEKLDRDLLKIWGSEKGTESITGTIKRLDLAMGQMKRSRDEALSRTREEIEKRANMTIGSIDPDPVLGDICIHPVTFRLGREKKGMGAKRVIPMAFLSAGEREILALSILSSLPVMAKGSLILDSPFPHLDQRRREKLLRSLPEIAERVYLSLPEGNLSEDEIGYLAGKWKDSGRGFRHYLLKPSPGGSVLRNMGEEAR